MPRLTQRQWDHVEQAVKSSRLRQRHGLPKRSSKSVLIATFNIRKLGSAEDRTDRRRKGRTPGAWHFLALACSPFDLIAVQEVQDELAGLRRLQHELKRRHRRTMKLLISDITGSQPGGSGMTERMAFLYDPRKIEHTELSSEITVDRAQVVQNLFARRQEFARFFEEHAKSLAKWEERAETASREGKRRPSKPTLKLPAFVTFIRAPHEGSFRVRPVKGAEPLDFVVVNAHLLYGEHEDERLQEFLELVRWLTLRAKYRDRLYAPNFLLLGDCNLETDNLVEAAAADNPPAEATASARVFLEWKIKSLNEGELKSRTGADVNFPLLDDHPVQGPLRTNARQSQTYDQIGLFCRDPRLPRHDENTAVTGTDDRYDYGVFRFTDLLAEVLEPADWKDAKKKQGGAVGSPFEHLEKTVRDRVVGWVGTDVSDHLPAWIRLPRPGVAQNEPT